MEIVVCVKQVPGTTQVEVDPVTGVLKRDGVEGKLNPYDLYAVEMALQLAAADGDRVRTLSMGPPQARQALLETVMMGAHSGTLVSDRRFGGADVLATSYTLAQAIRGQGRVDLVLCGKQTTDGDTAQVGAELAEFLGWPHANNVRHVCPDGPGWVKAEVDMDSYVAIQRLPLPCVLCAGGGVNTPRLPSYKRKKQLTEDCVCTVGLEDFDDQDPSHYGLAGSPTQVERIFPPEKNAEKELLEGPGEVLAARLAEILRRRRLI